MTTQPLPWNYWAYGCRVNSAIPIPIFLPWSATLQAQVKDRQSISVTVTPAGRLFKRLPANVTQQNLAIQSTGQATTLYLKDIATFSIEQGHQITCDPSPKATEEALSLALSGLAMAALLCQRHYFIAHGSAIARGQEGVIFLGDSGAGKSSFAMALHQAGCPIITDDLIAIQMIEGSPYILPAFPQTRVTVETAMALGLDWSTLIPLSTPHKRGFRFQGGFSTEVIPIRQIYILKRSQERVGAFSLEGHEKVMQLMHHSEAMALFASGDDSHFLACADLANKLSIQYFERPMDWEKLVEVIAYIQGHWEKTPHSST